MRVLFLVGAVLALDKERPVSKVIKLLEKMSAELSSDADKDKAIYEKLSCWCETNTNEKAAAIAAADRSVNEGVAAIERNSAKAAQLKAEVKQVEQELHANEVSLNQATSVHETEAAESTQEQKDLAQSVQALSNAVGVLKKHQAFLQVGNGGSAQVAEVQGIVQRVLATAKLAPAKRHALQSLVQRVKPGSYNAQSGAIFGILESMKEEFERNLGSEQKEFDQSGADYQQLAAAKTKEIAAGKAQAKQKTALLADTEVALAQAKEDVQAARSQRSADVNFQQDLAVQCQQKDQDYAARSKTRAQETAAISETIKILQDDDAHDSFSKTLGFVQKHAAAYHVAAQNSAAVQKDVFKKVRSSIDQMVEGLKTEAKDDTKHRDACISELNANEKAQAIKQRELSELQTAIEKATQQIAALKKEIAQHTAEVAEAQKQMQDASQGREAENKEFQESVREQRATQAVLKRALERLAEFYGFVQEDEPHAPVAFEKEYKSNAGAGGVMQLLQNIIDESTEMEHEALKAEQDSQAAYESFIKDSNAAVLDLTESIARKSGEKAEQEGVKAGAEADRASALQDAENLQKTAAALHSSCDFLLQNFETRRAARDAELGALQDAKAIFSGADFT